MGPGLCLSNAYRPPSEDMAASHILSKEPTHTWRSQGRILGHDSISPCCPNTLVLHLASHPARLPTCPPAHPQGNLFSRLSCLQQLYKV